MADSSAPVIVVIEDEAPIQKFLTASLQVEGFRVVAATTAKDGLRLLTQEHPAIALLDLGLPDSDGITVIESVRSWSTIPIIVLSARGEEKSKIQALDAGADDYLTKPFGVGELLARIRSALRRSMRPPGADQDHTFHFGQVHGDLATRQVFVDQTEVKLTKIEFDLLAILVRNCGRVLTHQYLLKEVWGPGSANEPHYVRVFMANLRKKLEPNPSRPQFLLTEQGIGYRLRTPTSLSEK
ncbi:KDP operon transcriptional regulatory protein KdpE [Pirellula sp. SH-Sr6A]|uniref:response regulator n=1 Tax=Pirellula sp. SH-Sr6A TaxID=1632865 RepID=UPI00078BF613|nr:response regulator [Pirellula sp. SH-Sr6A]AMV35390.1 KDP operon transcriptional regulatory protein KdpE [Pirellula sp. SH-Sr6A]